MRVLFVGDVFATPGLKALRAYLGAYGGDYDLRVVNAENATGGRGLSEKHFDQVRDAGADVVTLGNHTFDQRDTADLLERSTHLVRPLNYPPGTPGLGATTVAVGGTHVTVAQVMGRLFMDPLDDPFRALDDLFASLPEGRPVIVDAHVETTAESKVLGYHVAGRAAALLGTHTHVQTADEQLLNGTAYLTDVGMTGVEASSIGVTYDGPYAAFRTQRKHRFTPAEGAATVCAVALELEGPRATSIERIRWRHDPATGGGAEPGDGRTGHVVRSPDAGAEDARAV
jgi:metallophosphoesterase (TIGR00282 family)